MKLKIYFVKWLRGKCVSDSVNRRGKKILRINNGGLHLRKIKKSKLNLKEAEGTVFRGEIDETKTRNSVEENQQNKI